jgi:large subunit ribosomal protein L10
LAFSKERKSEIIARYTDWFDKSQAVYILSYSKMNMKSIDTVRAKIRDGNGEIHVIKNTLFKHVLDDKSLNYPKGFMESSNIVAFAHAEPAAMAKLLNDATRNSEIFKVKGGYLDGKYLDAKQIKELADLPPLAVMRARLLGALQAPAAQLQRTLLEPGRSLASVFKAYSERESAPSAA